MPQSLVSKKKILALRRAILAQFDAEKWDELGYLTESSDVIDDHPRLLRSLYFGDDDYGWCVQQVLSDIIDRDSRHEKIIEDFVGLEAWLRENDLSLHAELFGTLEAVSLAHLEDLGRHFNVHELGRHVVRIRSGLHDDPAQAIGSAKDLLETVLKTVLAVHGAKPVEDLPELLKRTQKELDLDPRSVAGSTATANIIKRTLSNLGQIVIGVAEVRNLHGTGHGRSRADELHVAHARLVVNAAIAVATFILEVWQTRTVQDEDLDADDLPF